MKSKKVWNAISVIVWVALLAAGIITGALIWRLDILPTQYLAILFAVLVFILVLTGMLMFQPQGKWQRKRGHAHQVIGYILSVAIIIGCIFASSAISKVLETMSAVTETTRVTAIVDVYVLTDDAAQEIEDAKDYTFAVTESYDWKNTQSAVAAITEQLGNEIKTVNYPTVFAMVDALYANEVDALILNSAYIDILAELEPYADFLDRARVIHEHSIEEAVQKETEPTEGSDATTEAADPQEPTEPQETVEPQETTIPMESAPTEPEQANGIEPFLMYLSGSDTRSKLLTTSRSDVNILAVVNPQTKQILLINTPRDYYVGNPAGNGALDKLTHCGIYGIDCSMEALSELYGEKIDYYAQINFTGFETLIDAVGGVTVYSDVSFTTLHGKHYIRAGENLLDGNQALCFARERYALSGGDNDRGKNQMKVIEAVIDKMSAGTIITNYTEILDSLKDMFVTNMTQEDISQLVKMQLSDMAQWNVQSYAVTGTGDSECTYSMPGMYAYVMHPNMQTVEFASGLIDRVLAGDILTDEEMIMN